VLLTLHPIDSRAERNLLSPWHEEGFRFETETFPLHRAAIAKKYDADE
jgi:hypothetical protein